MCIFSSPGRFRNCRAPTDFAWRVWVDGSVPSALVHSARDSSRVRDTRFARLQEETRQALLRVNRSAFGGVLQECALDVGAEDGGNLKSFFVNRVEYIRCLLARSIEQSKWVYLAHAKTLECGIAKYPIRLVVCKTFTVPAGYLNASQEKFNSQRDWFSVAWTIELSTETWRGIHSTFNTTRYEPFQCTSTVRRLVYNPSQWTLQTDSMSRLTLVFSMVWKRQSRRRERYSQRKISQRIRLVRLRPAWSSPDLTDTESFSLARQGTVRVDMTFGEALPSTVTIVSYAEFKSIIEIDRNWNVVFDFNNQWIPGRLNVF